MHKSRGVITLGAAALFFVLAPRQASAFPPAQIAQKVSEGIGAAQPSLGGHDVHIAVHDGTVNLTGTVSNQADRDRISGIASQVEGVRHVNNELLLSSNVMGSPSEKAQLILEQIKEDPKIQGYQITITANDGAARFTGTVSSQQDAERMMQIARGTPGITAVDNQLTVPNPYTDEQISEQVRTALQREHPETLPKLGIETRNGIVTLSGRVANHRVADAALSTALMAPGVRDIKSEIEY
jgi:osmotically-inducible protein OsmY